MGYEYIGTYSKRGVYRGEPKPGVGYPEDGRIYCYPTDCGYDLYINNRYVGWADSRFRVQEYDESRAAFRPKPQQEPPVVEVLEKPKPQSTTPTHSDFWNRIEKEIQQTLNFDFSKNL